MTDDPKLAKRLGDLAIEAEDTLLRIGGPDIGNSFLGQAASLT